MNRMHNSPHPGTVLAEWLEGVDDMTITAFAAHIGVTRATLSRILNGHSSITPDIASGSKTRWGQAARCGVACRWPMTFGLRRRSLVPGSSS